MKKSAGFLGLAAYFLIVSVPASAQKKKVDFNGRLLEMADLKQGDLAKIPVRAFGGKKLVVVEGNPESFGKGIALGNNRFLLSIPEGANASELFAGGIKSWAPVSASDKIRPDLRAKISNKNSGTRDVYIVCSPGMGEKQIRSAWKPAFGTIKDVWYGDGIVRFTVSANPAQIQAISNEAWSMQLEEAEGEIILHNQNGSENGRINTIASSGFGWTRGLSGNGVTVGIGDGGLVDYHADLQSHQFNLITSKLTSYGDHPDHVTGTIGGLGLINPAMKGMAPEARLLNHQTSNIISNAIILRSKQNMTLTNNSYGVTLSCTKSGQYNSTASLMDGQTAGNPDLLHVVSAGNAGTSTCSPYPAGFFNFSEGYPVAKNCLTVGQVNAADATNINSCKGPARDGRLKPEIMANGELNSTVTSDGYGFKSGSSQSAPVLTGTLALLSQRYRELNANQYPDAALLKALVCNTADDLGLPNADFSNGYGRLNARKARRALENTQFSSNSIASNSSQTVNLTVPSGVSSVKVMLAWTDPAAASTATKTLINDLNLSVLRADGSVTLPWVANPSVATVNQAAIRSIDSVNNMEQVTLTVSPGEILSIRTSSRTISGTSQKYWIVYDWVRPELVLTAPVQNQQLKTATAYGFRWDISNYSFSSLVLETSSDSITWTSAQTISTPASLNSSFTPSGTTFRRVWFRLRGTSSGQTIISNAVRIVLSPQPAPTASVCDRMARLSWTAVSGASRYEVFKLNRIKGTWDSQGFTSALQYFFNGLTNGTRDLLAVRPWFGNESGLMSLGVAATPSATACSWTGDLGISRLISPVSGRLNTSSAPVSLIQLELQNYANAAVTAQSCTLNYRNPDGIVQQFPLSLSIGAGLKQNYSLAVPFNNAKSGQQNLRFWLSTPGDVNTSNDTLAATVNVIPNEPQRTFPLTLNFETSQAFYLNATSAGVTGENRMDFISTNQARAFSSVKTPPSTFGSRSLVLDKERVDTRTGTSEAIFTINLSAFPSPRELKLSFDVLSFGTLTTGNAVSFRPSDQAAWINIRNLWQSSLVAGVAKSFTDIDLLALLAGAAPTSSFQLRFTFSGTRNSEIETLGGYAVDNIVLNLPSAIDLAANQLVLPPDNCFSENEDRFIQMQVQNISNSAVENVSVFYQVNGFSAVSEVIPVLNAGEIRNHTFSQKLSGEQFGVLEIQGWLSHPSDINSVNNRATTQKCRHRKVIKNYPYTESFESTVKNWFEENLTASNQWLVTSGTANLKGADTAANGMQFWSAQNAQAVNAAGPSYLHSPCFSLPGTSDLQISFNRTFNLSSNAKVWLEISDNGIDWIKLGRTGSGYNWYNTTDNAWSNDGSDWKPGSYMIPTGTESKSGMVRFRFVFQNENSTSSLNTSLSAGSSSDGRVGEGVFSLDDINIELSSAIDVSNPLNQTALPTTTENWLNFGNDNNRAAMMETYEGMQEANLQMIIHREGIRNYNDRYYLDRNFVLSASPAYPANRTIRLFITEEEMKGLMDADQALLTPMKLGVFQYSGPNPDLDIANDDFSNGSDFRFIPSAEISKIPTNGGLYLEFQGKTQSEFYISRSTLVDALPSQALRMAAADLPPHEPSVVKWLTPLDHEGRSLDKKMAWHEPASQMLYLDGLNGATSRIRLLDVKGQVLLDEEFTGFKFQTRTSGLAKGIYTLRLEQESGSETFRLVLD